MFTVFRAQKFDDQPSSWKTSHIDLQVKKVLAD